MYRFSSNLIVNLINLIFTVVEGLILLRIILKFFDASSGAPFVTWIYDTTDPLLSPFLGMFPSPALEGRYVLEFSAIFGLLVYALIGYLLSELIHYISYHSHYEERPRR